MRLGIVLLAACAGHAPPVDTAVETTVAPAAPPRVGAVPLRVVTFNIHGDAGERVADEILHDPMMRRADVLVLEEVHGVPGCSAACAIARELGYHAAFAPEFVDRDGTDGVAIVSRLPIRSTDVIALPYFNVHLNDERRTVALAAAIDLGDGTAPVMVYAVHLVNRLTVAQRRSQMLPVLRHAEQHPARAIIAGDFNTSPFTWIAHLIPVPTGTQDDRLEALARSHGFATPVKASGATSRYLGMKLDGIYTRGFATSAFATDEAGDVSDHIALFADLLSSQ